MNARNEFFRLFHTFNDTSSEYKLRKIGYNEDEFEKLIKNWPDNPNEKLTCVGFLGDPNNVSVACQYFLELSLEHKQKLEEFIKEQATSNEECLILYPKANKIAFIYCSSNSTFQKGPLDEAALTIDYVRYIADTCEKILVLPPKSLESEETIQNPFQDTANTYVQLQQRPVCQNEKISIKQLNTEQKVSMNYNSPRVCSGPCQPHPHLSQDWVPHFVTYHFHPKNVQKPKHAYLPEELLKENVSKTNLAYITYDDAVKHLKKWSDKHAYFANIEGRAMVVFKTFIHNDKIVEFHDRIKRISELYNQAKHKILQDRIELCIREISCTKFAKEGADSSNTDNRVIRDGMHASSCNTTNERSPVGYVSVTTNSTNSDRSCTPSCITINEYLEKKKGLHTDVSELINTLKTCDTAELLSHKIHHSKVEKLIKKLKGATNNLNDIYDKELKRKRIDLVDQFSQWLTNNHVRFDEVYESKIVLNVFNYNPIPDAAGNINEIMLTMKNSRIFDTLSKIQDTREIYCSQIVFISDKIGFINIANCPKDQATLFYFNMTNPACPQFEIEQKLTSKDSRIIINTNEGIYIIYDNTERRADRGKLHGTSMRLGSIKTISDLYENTIDANDAPDTKLKHIHTMCFLHGSNLIYLIDKEYNLIEYQYLNGKMKLVYKRINEGKQIRKVSLQSTDELPYKHVSTTSNGKCILLQCDCSIDIYDLTWTMIGKIIIDTTKEFLGYKTFDDSINTYVVKIERTTNKDIKHDVYSIQGLSLSRTFDVQRDSVKTASGFPYLDLFYLIKRKFGPLSGFIGCPRKLSVSFFRPENFVLTEEKLDNYFTQLHTTQIHLDIEPLTDPDYKSIFGRLATIELAHFYSILKTRVPIHIATIEDSNLFPLNHGKNITYELQICSATNTPDVIQWIAESTHVGAYETLLKEYDRPIKVIAVVGQQSGGKSYLLNRLTGTRFNVAATRCTDGIWMSIAFFRSQPIVVLDCEGLFSTRRNNSEEVKLCLALSALTDIFILNRDSSFNRHLTDLFKRFAAKCCGRIRGSKLFKGFLLMVVRDISSQESIGVCEEFLSNIRQQTSNRQANYLENLFRGKCDLQCLHHFENRIFDVEIDQLRQLILESPSHWATGSEFLDNLKLTLAQVHIDDDTLIDVHHLKMMFSRLESESQKMLKEGGALFSNCNPIAITLDNLNENDEQSMPNLVISQDKIDFTKYIYPESNGDSIHSQEDLSCASNLFHEMLSDHFQCNYDEIYHNRWFRNVNKLLEYTLDVRVKFILDYVHTHMPSDSMFTTEIEDFETSLKVKLDQLKLSSQLCIRTCRHCKRICSKVHNHREDCDCQTDHICKIKCQLCSDNTNKLCCHIFGHDGKHKCNDRHVCGKPCNMTISCKMLCARETQHEDVDNHDCNNRHYCEEKCSENFACDKTCRYDIREIHTNHTCNDTKCPHTCSISECRRQCSVANHFHQQMIIEGSIDNSIPNFHVCDSTHECLDLCEQNGVCSVGYNMIEKEWKNEVNSFPYIFYEPIRQHSKCCLKIPMHSKTHENENHKCTKAEHRCESQCPECRSFCQLPYGHLETYHSTNAHRNKECNVFVTCRNMNQSVKIKNEGAYREYRPGESCTPELCNASCERKGRAHFHLKLCPGDENCPAKIYQYVKHSDDKWYPFPKNTYDLWLCEQYWHSLGWSVPYNEDIKSTISKCAFICSHIEHNSDDESFCIKDAWHKDKHEFNCKHKTISKLDIVFCCDTTGSMESYIEESKNTVQKIMTSAKSIKDVKFRFVAYRDHGPEENYLTKCNKENLTNERNIVKFIKTLDASGGGDTPEAVLDGLHNAVTETKWRGADTMKYLIHIADAPPHGRQYTGECDDNWPNGCPCNLTIEQISVSLNSTKIRYKLMKVGSGTNIMAAEFRKYIKYFEESNLNDAADLSKTFIDILVRELQVEEIDVTVD